MRWSKDLAAGLACLSLAACGLAPDPALTESPITSEWNAIDPIEPEDSSQTFLDSGLVAFETGTANVFHYTYVTGGMTGGMGPSFERYSAMVKTRPSGDSAVDIGLSDYSIRIPHPPAAYRKDTTLENSSRIPAGSLPEVMGILYPSGSRVPNGIFVLDDGRRLLVANGIAGKDGGAEGGFWQGIYLEPYGLIYYSSHSPNTMGFYSFQIWLDRWNGTTLDKAQVFGRVKGLMAAYRDSLRVSVPAEE